MNTDQKARFLRAARAWLAEEQKAAAASAGVAWNTLVAAERGERLSDKTWEKMAAYYGARGVTVREAGKRIVITAG